MRIVTWTINYFIMKNFALLLSFLLMISGLAKAQEHLPKASDYVNFKKTRTLVVMDPNTMSDFNFKIKDVMKKHWDITPFDFISEDEFQKKKDDPSYSFLMTTTVTFDADKTKARYTFLSLLMGEENAKVKNMTDLISIPLSYLKVEDSNYAYKMDAFIRFIQDHVKLMIKDPSLISKNPLQYYNKNTKSLAGKTLLLTKADLQNTIDTEAKISKVYRHKFKIVSEEEIEEAIERMDPDVVFLHKVGPGKIEYKTRCFKIIVGANDSQFYYFDYHTLDKSTPDKLLMKDLKSMSK